MRDALARETSTSRPASTRVDGPRVRSEKAIARRVLGFFGTSGPGPGSGDTRETSRRAPRLPAPIGASASLSRAPARRHRPDATPGDGAETRAGTANRLRDGRAFSPDWLDRRGFLSRGTLEAPLCFFAHLADNSPTSDWSLTSLLFFVKHTGPNDRDCPQEEAFGEDQQPLDRGCVSGGYPEEARREVGCPRRRARRRASRDQGAPAQGEGRQEGQEVMTVCETSHVMRERWRVRRLDCRRDDDDVTTMMIRFNRVAVTTRPRSFRRREDWNS